MREPHELGFHCDNTLLSFRPRLVELAEPDRGVTGKHYRAVAGVDDDDL
ncbi:MAG: hypothetical protein L0H96_19855 [Humibacillus sp.]|nr:hypothetical protein [Humibacillus sp.]MDN5779152.1 hypothetical protein [Humibacillus sp.]